jgi:RNA polymerase sigma factor (sigma-70 family)
MAGTYPRTLTRLLEASEPSDEREAWEAFTRRCSRLLLGACHRASGHGYDSMMDRYAYVLEQLEADDYRRLRAFSADGQTKFSTWLVVVANRLCVDYHRKRYGRSRATSDTNPGAVDDVDHTRLPDRSGLDPESALAASEIGEALSRAIASLSTQDRLLLAFRFEHDATTRDLGDVMGFPTRFHAYRRLKQVLTTLRLSLEEEGFGEGEP